MASEKVTNAELEVLKILWKSDTARSVAEIRTELEEQLGWKATTVKTLLYNLRDKGAVEEVARGVYRPVVHEADITKDLIRRLFDGSARKLVSALLDNGDLSESDIAELRGMLDDGAEGADDAEDADDATHADAVDGTEDAEGATHADAVDGTEDAEGATRADAVDGTDDAEGATRADAVEGKAGV